MSTTASRLHELLGTDPPDPAAIRDVLDRASPAERLEAIRSLGGPAIQRRLWDAAAAAPRVGLADLVPADAKPLREVIFHGKNSLPAFTLFQKRFCRPGGASDRLWGYNHQQLAWLTGPGYFVVADEPAHGAAIDYRQVPTAGVPGWPAVKPNDVGLSRFVYRDMVDYLRRVSTHVMIGRATRHGQELDNFFVLCRD